MVCESKYWSSAYSLFIVRVAFLLSIWFGDTTYSMHTTLGKYFWSRYVLLCYFKLSYITSICVDFNEEVTIKYKFGCHIHFVEASITINEGLIWKQSCNIPSGIITGHCACVHFKTVYVFINSPLKQHCTLTINISRIDIRPRLRETWWTDCHDVQMFFTWYVNFWPGPAIFSTIL